MSRSPIEEGILSPAQARVYSVLESRLGEFVHVMEIHRALLGDTIRQSKYVEVGICRIRKRLSDYNCSWEILNNKEGAYMLRRKIDA